jgi:ribosome maturation factor RimP
MVDADGAQSPLTVRVETIIAPSLEAMGYQVVRVALTSGRRATLQVMAERIDGLGMAVDDCAAISRAVSALLDVEDPIEAAYTLEVSSPGIDRPLVRRKDFQRFAGFEARVETHRLVEGRKRFRGKMLGMNDADEVIVVAEGVEYLVPFSAIQRSRLILTDELIAASPDKPRANAEDLSSTDIED